MTTEYSENGQKMLVKKGYPIMNKQIVHCIKTLYNVKYSGISLK